MSRDDFRICFHGDSARLAYVPLQASFAAQEAPASKRAVMLLRRSVSPGPSGKSEELCG